MVAVAARDTAGQFVDADSVSMAVASIVVDVE